MTGSTYRTMIQIKHDRELADRVASAFSPDQLDMSGDAQGLCTSFKECRDADVTNPVRNRMSETAARHGMEAEWRGSTVTLTHVQ